MHTLLNVIVVRTAYRDDYFFTFCYEYQKRHKINNLIETCITIKKKEKKFVISLLEKDIKRKLQLCGN